jgi:uncharacterized protein
VTGGVRERLRAALPAAMKRRDAALVGLLRETLAARENAEAVPGAGDDPGSLALEASPVGAGAREVARRELSEDDVVRLVRGEISERQVAAAVYEQAGRPEQAQQLREQAGTLAELAGLEGSPGGPDGR